MHSVSCIDREWSPQGSRFVREMRHISVGHKRSKASECLRGLSISTKRRGNVVGNRSVYSEGHYEKRAPPDSGGALEMCSKYGTDRERFELSIPLRVCRFSRPVHSTALPPVQYANSGSLAALKTSGSPVYGQRQIVSSRLSATCRGAPTRPVPRPTHRPASWPRPHNW